MSKRGAVSWRQIQTFTSASIKSRYRNTFAGLIWVILSPLLMFGAQAYAFKYVLKINVENYALFLVTGLIPWIFLMQSVSMGTTIIVSQARLLKSFPIHPLVCLIAMIFDNFINFFIVFVCVLAPTVIVTGGANLSRFFMLPIPLFSLFIAIVGLVWILSVLQVFFHDTKFVADFGMSIAFYLTPIFYPVSFVGEDMRWMIDYNPIYILFRPIQGLTPVNTAPEYFEWLGQSYALSISIFILALFVWRSKKNQLYFRL